MSFKRVSKTSRAKGRCTEHLPCDRPVHGNLNDSRLTRRADDSAKPPISFESSPTYDQTWFFIAKPSVSRLTNSLSLGSRAIRKFHTSIVERSGELRGIKVDENNYAIYTNFSAALRAVEHTRSPSSPNFLPRLRDIEIVKLIRENGKSEVSSWQSF